MKNPSATRTPRPALLHALLAGTGVLAAALAVVDGVRAATAPTEPKVAKALRITLEAKPGLERHVVRLLEDIRGIVEDEPGTRPWYASRRSRREFEIFETFPNAAARSRHLSGRGARLLMARAPILLVRPPGIDLLDVILDKAG